MNADHAPLHRVAAPRLLSEAAIDEQTSALAAAIETPGSGLTWLLVFRVSGERMAIAAPCVERVMMPVPLRRVPHRNHPAFRGLVATEGEIVPAGSLERLLDLAQSPRPADTARLVLLGPAGRAWAFEVDAVEGVHGVMERHIRPAPSTLSREKGSACRLLASLEGGDACVLDAEVLRSGWEASAA